MQASSDLLSLQELARSLASLEDGADCAVDAAARTGMLRALDEHQRELLGCAPSAGAVKRPASRAASERLDGLRLQLLDAFLRGDACAATVVAAAAADTAWRSGAAEVAGGGEWALDVARQIDVTQLLAAGSSLRCHAPAGKRKHEGADSPLLVSRPKLPSSLPDTPRDPHGATVGAAAHPPAAHDVPLRFIGPSATEQYDAQYDADDDGSDWGCDLFDEPAILGLPPRGGAHPLPSLTLRPGAQPPAPPELPDAPSDAEGGLGDSDRGEAMEMDS